MMRAIDVRSRKAYLQWKKEWLAEYKQTVDKVREVKKHLRTPHDVNLCTEHAFYQMHREALRTRIRHLHFLQEVGKEYAQKAASETLVIIVP